MFRLEFGHHPQDGSPAEPLALEMSGHRPTIPFSAIQPSGHRFSQKRIFSALERLGDDHHLEVGLRVRGHIVLVALVHHFQVLGLQALRQLALNRFLYRHGRGL